MIRINLLGVDRQKTKKAAIFDVGKQITLACSLILVLGALGIGWWYWSLTQASTRVDQELAATEQEVARLQTLLAEVRQFEAQRAQLQQRVALIEQLRSGQGLPVQLLDHVSRSLPDMLWLTQMDQEGDSVTIQGQSTTLIALSDFVGNLGNGNILKKPIELVNSQVESVTSAGQQRGIELIRFTVKAQVAGLVPAAGTTPAGRGAAPPAAGAPAAAPTAR
jgi:type IV pilus assembly protein PilN